MNIMEPVVNNFDEYINKTVKYLLDDNLKRKIESKIKSKKDLLFNDKESLNEWQNLLINLYNDKK